MTFQELFIANLKEYRKLRKISQLKLAEQCRSSQTYIAEIEAGKKFPSPVMIEKIARVLGVESFVLFQNLPPAAENRAKSLTPVQKDEIIEKIRTAARKIVELY